eukprot:SAG31_NODE_13528_length_863_cov_1.594241_1_plen_99_part_10
MDAFAELAAMLGEAPMSAATDPKLPAEPPPPDTSLDALFSEFSSVSDLAAGKSIPIYQSDTPPEPSQPATTSITLTTSKLEIEATSTERDPLPPQQQQQ